MHIHKIVYKHNDRICSNLIEHPYQAAMLISLPKCGHKSANFPLCIERHNISIVKEQCRRVSHLKWNPGTCRLLYR